MIPHSRFRRLALTLALSGCVAAPPSFPKPSASSHAEGIDAADLDILADAAVDLVRRQASAANPIIGLEPAGDDRFARHLADKLNGAGYSVTTGDRLRYQVGPVGDAVMLRISIDGRDCARLYARGADGRLGPAGPLSVRSAGP